MVLYEEDLKMIVVGGLLAGIALGWIAKMMYDVRKAKGAPRPFSGKQIQRWHLHPRDAEILTNHKDPQQRALDELEKLSETIDNGKPLNDSKNIDVPRAINNLRFYASVIINQS